MRVQRVCKLRDGFVEQSGFRSAACEQFGFLKRSDPEIKLRRCPHDSHFVLQQCDGILSCSLHLWTECVQMRVFFSCRLEMEGEKWKNKSPAVFDVASGCPTPSRFLHPALYCCMLTHSTFQQSTDGQEVGEILKS